jgi:hypothetical protein
MKYQLANNIGIQKTITVFDELGQPLPMAEIYVIGIGSNNISKGTITNFDGIATITAMPNDTVGISHLSYIDEQFQFKDLPKTIQLEVDQHQLNEVDVIAQPKQAGIGWVLGAIGLGFLLTSFSNKSKPMNAPKPKKTAKKPLKVTL